MCKATPTLEVFDEKLGEAMKLAKPGDLILIDADHGCDPTFKGTDHTREYIPIVAWSPEMKVLTLLGDRRTYADIAATDCGTFWVTRPVRGGILRGTTDEKLRRRLNMGMKSYLEDIEAAAKTIEKKCGKADIAVVLGERTGRLRRGADGRGTY